MSFVVEGACRVHEGFARGLAFSRTFGSDGSAHFGIAHISGGEPIFGIGHIAGGERIFVFIGIAFVFDSACIDDFSGLLGPRVAHTEEAAAICSGGYHDGLWPPTEASEGDEFATYSPCKMVSNSCFKRGRLA